jgi:hypothetical protein
VSEHAAAVREVYSEAIADAVRPGSTVGADVAELGFLHSALVDLGFAAPAGLPRGDACR